VAENGCWSDGPHEDLKVRCLAWHTCVSCTAAFGWLSLRRLRCVEGDRCC